MITILVPTKSSQVTELQNYPPNTAIMEGINKTRYVQEKDLREHLEWKLSCKESQLEILTHWLELYRYRMCEIERLSDCELSRTLAKAAREEFYTGISSEQNLFDLSGITVR